MRSRSIEAVSDISKFRVSIVLIFTILNLAVFFMRALSVWHYGTLFFSVGGDGAVIYPIWKEMHHLPVYSWPLSFPFTLSTFNYLFYLAYAVVLKLAGASGASIMIWGSLFTPTFVIIGAIAQWKLVQRLLDLSGVRDAASLLFALGLWTCTSIIAGWAFTIRPDMPAVALVMIALSIVVRKARFAFAYAGVVFYLAWSFKQSEILALVGVLLFLAVRKRWREASVMVAVFALLVSVTLLLGTPEYRYNILVAPRLVKEFSFAHAFPLASKFLVGNVYWLLAPVALLFATPGRQVKNAVHLLLFCLGVALIGGLAGLAKVGAYSEYLLEAFVVGSTLFQIAAFTAPGKLANALIILGCIQPAVQMASLPSGSAQPHLFGTVGIANPRQYAEAVALRDRLAPMRKPMFTPNGVFSLPWYSSANDSPALIIEPIFHDATRDNCSGGCVEGMLQRGEIPTVMLLSSGNPYQSSLNTNYKKVAEAPYSERMWSIYEFSPQRPGPDRSKSDN
jgi:hypothetical protein